jgi:hypothetical protein
MLEQLFTQHEHDDVEDSLAAPVDDPMLARRLMIALAVNARKQERLRATMAAVLGEYQSLIDQAEERERRIRESLEVYVERNGSVSFPDVGSMHLQKRGASVRIVEPEAFAAWLIKNGQSGQVSVDQKYTFGPTAKKSAVAAIREGEVAPGCEPVEPSQSLVIKGVK